MDKAKDGPGEPAKRKEAWLLVAPESVPERWSNRATPMLLLPLLPEEMDQLFQDQLSQPSIESGDEELSRLLVRGLTIPEIATVLHVSERTVERRLARLRSRLGASSTSELALALARRGFR